MDGRPLRVCLFPGTLGSGGVTRNMFRLAAAMREQGVAVDLFTTRTTDAAAPTVPPGIDVVMSGASVRSCLLPLRRHIRSTRPSAVIAARTYINIVAAAAARTSGVRPIVIATERTVASVEALHDPRRVHGLVRFLRELAYPFVDHVVAVSPAVEDDLLASAPRWASRVQVIPNPIVSKHLQRAAALPIDRSIAERIAEFSPLLVSVGRFTAAKDQRTLLAAFAKMRAKFPSAGVVLVGEGSLRKDLATYSARLGISEAVVMPGFLQNPLPLMRAADVFVHSSRWEGLPTVLVEALALGTRVVATDCPGVADVVGGGQFGTLAPVGDADALARAIECELHQPRVASDLMASADRFRADRVARQYVDLITRSGDGV